MLAVSIRDYVKNREKYYKNLSGHWKQQPCGHKNLERKWIWVNLYKTGDHTEDKEN